MQRKKLSKNNKKGAIELGMNTIIIVVIGITLLSLSLVWIRGMMGEEGIGVITKGAFGQAEAAISDIYEATSEELSIVPETMAIAPGKSGNAKVVFSNLEDADASGVNFNVESVAEGNQKVSCQFANLKTTAGPYDVPSGKARELQLLIKVDSSSGLGTAVCTVSVEGFEKSIIITVEK